jgi:integrase
MKIGHKPPAATLTEEDWARALADAEGETLGMMLTALATARPLTEIVNLRHSDADTGAGAIRFVNPKTERIVLWPMDPRLRLWLEQARRAGFTPEAPLFPRLAGKNRAALSLRLQEIREKSGVDVNVVSLRRALLDLLMQKAASSPKPVKLENKEKQP